MLLALDTSTSRAGVALHRVDGPVASISWHSGRMHTVQLLPATDALMRQAGVVPSDLSAVAVAIGPGSFTGVRVGLATAKGIASSLDLPLIGISTLLYTAWPYRHWGLPIRACLPLGRNRLAVGAYAPGPHGGLMEEKLSNPAASDAVEPGHIVYCGEMGKELLDALRDQPQAIIIPEAEGGRNPAVLAELAWERLMRGEIEQPATLQAIYVDSSQQTL